MRPLLIGLRSSCDAWWIRRTSTTMRMRRRIGSWKRLEVQQFRDDLYGALLADFAARVAEQSEEVQRHFQWVLDVHECWRELLNEAARARAGHADHGTNPDRPGNAGAQS